MTLRCVVLAIVGSVGLLAATTGFEQRANNTSIKGTVHRAGTGEPVSGATVTLTPTESSSSAPILKASVGLSGNFTFNNVAPGEYRISAAADGYIEGDYHGQQGSTAVSIRIAEGTHLTDVGIEITPAAALSGRIRDEAGTVVVGVQVQLLYPEYTATGGRTFVSKGIASTNETGEYRMESVPSGHYYLSSPPAVPSSPRAIPPAIAVGPAASYGVTYYPGVANISEAIPIDLRPGQTVAAVDFTDLPRKTYAIRGRLFTSQTSDSAVVILWLLESDLSSAPIPVSRRNVVYDHTTGAFEIREVPPGTYRVEAREEINGKSIAALATVTITNGDVDSVTLRAIPPTRVTGHVAVSTGDLSSVDHFENLRVGIVAPARYFLSGKVDENGDFQIEEVAAGDYRVMVCYGMLSNPSGCARSTPGIYLKYAAYSGDNAIDTPLHITGTESPELEVLLSQHPAQVSGTVTTANHQPVQHAKVVVVPNDPIRWDLYKVASTDRDGKFNLPGIAPGTYRVFSWKSIEENAFFNPDVIRDVEAYGTVVTLSDDDHAKLELTVVPDNE